MINIKVLAGEGMEWTGQIRDEEEGFVFDESITTLQLYNQIAGSDGEKTV